MIFSWLQRKRKEPTRGELMASVFDFDLSHLLEMLNHEVEMEEPVVRAMVLVALANIPPYLHAHKSLATGSSPGENLPTNHADFGKMVARLLDKYPPINQYEFEVPNEAEIKFRRLYHFYRASILYVASERAHSSGEQLEDLAKVWSSYIDSARYIGRLLEQTAIWSRDETDWFDPCIDESSYIRYVVYTVVPNFLSGHSEMIQVAKQFEISPSLLNANKPAWMEQSK